ncbi:hypothetical protein D4764_03G0003470 [Takifugu flavidus]|uniref:CCHC-type domain-containing protein n=1 Tax=Takifugu flavidus TaxID=433684 RepID=A0A5C6N8U9_9TELE|nr:hypothetical protein D4764_03G0003470 [Takifugu flavidus]
MAANANPGGGQSRHGKLVSPIRKLLSGCWSPLLSHVVSHRRQVRVILNRAEEFNYRFVVRVDDFDYVLFATSSALKCFNCGEEGHLAARSGGEASVVRCGAVRGAPLSRAERRWSRRRREKGVSVFV